MDLNNSIIFGGIDSANYGIYVAGNAVFNSPERDVTMIDVPGRNGQLTFDNGRFMNIEVTYNAFVTGDNSDDIADNIRGYRNAIGSLIGYQRLEDTFHTDEYRQAIFRNGIEVEPTIYQTGGYFDITFDCKPQRFLTSGENAVDLSTAIRQTITGNPVSFYYQSGNTIVHSMTARKGLYQGGSGNPSPNNYRPIESFNSLSFKLNSTTSTASLGNTYYAADINLAAKTITPYVGAYVFTGNETITLGTTGFFTCTLSGEGATFDQCSHLRFRGVSTPLALANYDIRLASLANHQTVLQWRYDEITSAADMKTKLAQWYAAGEPMVVAGTLRAAVLPSSFTLSPAFSYATGANTLEFTGVNNSTITIDITTPATLNNPTNFEVRPLLSITGTGTMNVGETTITIGGNGSQMYLDCDLCEAWSESGGVITNRNGDVTMSGPDFPSLPPGGSVISADNTFTQILVTPRWWRI